MARTLSVLFCVTMMALVVSGCATQPRVSANAPGFFYGLLHGAISPVALIVGFFSDARVYAFPNSGWWYDLGFMLGLSAWGGGAATAAK